MATKGNKQKKQAWANPKIKYKPMKRWERNREEYEEIQG